MSENDVVFIAKSAYTGPSHQLTAESQPQLVAGEKKDLADTLQKAFLGAARKGREVKIPISKPDSGSFPVKISSKK